MHRVPSYILVLCLFLVFSLMGLSLAYVWFPDSISEQTFVKVGVSFGVLLIGAILMSLIGQCMGGHREGKGGGCCPHKKAEGDTQTGGH